MDTLVTKIIVLISEVYLFQEESNVYLHTIVHRQIKGAVCCHLWHIHLAVATAGSILLSQGCIF